MKKLPVLLTACFVLTAFPAYAQRGPSGPVGVIVSPVQKTDWVETIEALGTLKAREEVVISATVADKVATINFEDGQHVKKGDIILELDHAQEAAELEAARSAYSEAEKQYNRAKELRRQGATPQSVLDEQRRVYEIAKAQVGVAESKLQDHIIRAPFSGRLGIRQVSPGAYVNTGESITTLTDTSTLRLDFSVPELYLSSVAAGQHVQVTTSVYRGKVFEGIVSAVDNRVDTISRAFSVRATLPNPDGLLKAGMLMTVHIQKNPEPTLALPESTLIPQSTRNFIYVVDNTAEKPVARKKEVTIGRRKAGQVEVLDGVTGDELVVTHGALKLAEGRPVAIVANQADGHSITDILNSLDDQPKGKK